MAWISKDKPEGKRQAGQSEGTEMDNLEAAVPREGSEEINAFVGKGVSFKGVISYNGTVRIDGNLDGEIHTEGVLLVGEDAVLTAKITAGTVVCKGKITGDISAREGEIAGSCRCECRGEGTTAGYGRGRGLQWHVGDEPDRYARASGDYAGTGREAGERIVPFDAEFV